MLSAVEFDKSGEHCNLLFELNDKKIPNQTSMAKIRNVVLSKFLVADSIIIIIIRDYIEIFNPNELLINSKLNCEKKSHLKKYFRQKCTFLR